MEHLPLIIGYGGINAAGLSSTDQSYLNMVSSALDEAERAELLVSLRALNSEGRSYDANVRADGSSAESPVPKGGIATGKDASYPHTAPAANILAAGASVPQAASSAIHPTPSLDAALAAVQEDFFIRPIPRRLFDVTTAPYYRYDGKKEPFPVRFAGCLPTHFSPELCYPSHYHPRGLQLAIFAANDALNSTGVTIDDIRSSVPADKCAVYAGSSLGQLDDDSMGGLLTAALRERKTVTKQLPFSYPQMAADFVNAYVLKNLGKTGNHCGACATFLYNLRNAVEQIKSGSVELALVGASEAPIVPQLISAFHNMGALAANAKIGSLNPRQASIPFGNNYGFVMGESAQFVVLASEDVVCRLGACIYGMVPEVFVNADGGKHSISAPGPGNYITMGKATAAVQRLYGTEALRHKSYIQAHGTSTKQNRITESHIFSSLASAFGIKDWLVTAVKSHLGHSQAAAGGDQLINSLSFWRHGVLPGITTLQEPAEDVFTQGLDFNLQHKMLGADSMDVALINAKGFGGNNATAVLSSPRQARSLFAKTVGKKKMKEAAAKQEKTYAEHVRYVDNARQGRFSLKYDFEDAILRIEDVRITRKGVHIKGYPFIEFEP